MSGVVIGETLRRLLTNIGALIFVAFMAIVTFLTPNAGAPGKIWHPMFSLLVIVAAAQLIGPEFNSGTLQLVLVKPIRRSVYLLSRVAGVVLFIWIAVWFLVAVEVAGVALAHQAIAWGELMAFAVNVSAKVILVCSLFAFLGSFARAYFSVAYYFFFLILLSALPAILRMFKRKTSGFAGAIGDFVRAHPVIDQAIVWLWANLFPTESHDIDRDWLLIVISNAAVALLLACLIFRRREVPYGAD